LHLLPGLAGHGTHLISHLFDIDNRNVVVLGQLLAKEGLAHRWWAGHEDPDWLQTPGFVKFDVNIFNVFEEAFPALPVENELRLDLFFGLFFLYPLSRISCALLSNRFHLFTSFPFPVVLFSCHRTSPSSAPRCSEENLVV